MEVGLWAGAELELGPQVGAFPEPFLPLSPETRWGDQGPTSEPDGPQEARECGNTMELGESGKGAKRAGSQPRPIW